MGIKVIAFTKNGCPKCEDAKLLLEGYDVTWLNTDEDESAHQRAVILGIKYLPTFLVGDDITLSYGLEQSTIKVRRLLEKAKSKQK